MILFTAGMKILNTFPGSSKLTNNSIYLGATFVKGPFLNGSFRIALPALQLLGVMTSYILKDIGKVSSDMVGFCCCH